MEELTECRWRFLRATEQVVVLRQRLHEMEFRYNRAKSAGQKAFLYSLELRMSTLEGLRDMYYDYACEKGDEVQKLRIQVYGR